MPGPVFRDGDRVALCPIEEADLPFVQRNYNDPAVRLWMPAADPRPAQDLAEDVLERTDTDDLISLLGCVDGDPVGMVSLFSIDQRSGRARIGAWVDPGYQGAGYGREMTAEMVAYAFEELRLHRLSANALVTNDASRATLESVGFTEEGVQRDAYFVDGEYVDRAMYGLLAGEWDRKAAGE